MAQYVKDFAEPSQPDYAKPLEKSETPVRHALCNFTCYYNLYESCV